MNSNIKHGAFALLVFALLVWLIGCGPKSESKSGMSTDAMNTEVDNSRINARDRNDATLTPGDQGTTPVDVQITQKIRKALTSGPSDYSMTAKNVKIITANGKVTLRGPVKSAAEKEGIVALAKGIAGQGNVEDQLEVKATL